MKGIWKLYYHIEGNYNAGRRLSKNACLLSEVKDPESLDQVIEFKKKAAEVASIDLRRVCQELETIQREYAVSQKVLSDFEQISRWTFRSVASSISEAK